MRSLLLLLGALVALAARPCLARGWGSYGLAAARVDSHQIRLNTLEAQIEKLEAEVDEAAASDAGQAAENLAARVSRIEGDGCPDKQFNCGGETQQCISDLLVCDGTADCEGSHPGDESDDRCSVFVPAGSTFEGDVHWDRCLTRKDQTVRIIITGNRRVSYFPSRVWVNALLTLEHEENGEPVSSTYSSAGFWNFGSRSLVLQPPSSRNFRIGVVCDFNTDRQADCELRQEASQLSCASMRVVRK